MYTQQLNTRLHLRKQRSLIETQFKTMDCIGAASVKSTKDHGATREQLRLLQVEGEQCELRLREELVVLRQGLENCTKETARGASQVEQGRLASVTNAIYKIWAEKEAALESIMSYLATLSNGAITQEFSPSQDPNLLTDIDTNTVSLHNKPSSSAHTSSGVTVSTQQLSKVLPSKGKPDRNAKGRAKAISQMQKWPGAATRTCDALTIQTGLLMLRDAVLHAPTDRCFRIDLLNAEKSGNSVKT